MKELLELRQRHIHPAERVQVAREARAVQHEYNALRRVADERARQLARLRAAFDALDEFNPEAPCVNVGHSSRRGAEAAEDARADGALGHDSGGVGGGVGGSGGAACEDGETAHDAAHGLALGPAHDAAHDAARDPFALAEALAGEDRRRVSLRSPSEGVVMMAVAQRAPPEVAAGFAERMVAIARAEATLEEEEDCTATLEFMQVRTSVERAQAESAAKESERAIRLLRVQYEKAKREVMRVRVAGKNVEKALDGVRSRSAVRSEERAARLEDLEGVRSLYQTLGPAGGDQAGATHPLLEKLALMASARAVSPDDLVRLRGRAAARFAAEAKQNKLDARFAELESGFDAAARVLNLTEPSPKTRVERVVAAARSVGTAMGGRWAGARMQG